MNNHQVSAKDVSCAIVTVSDSRGVRDDISGSLIRDRMEIEGTGVAEHIVIPDDVETICREIRRIVDARVDMIILTGGTGLSPRDGTYEAVSSLLEKRIDGFGELFRSLSFQEIGAAAMLSRAVAGTVDATLVFSLPGSPAAVRLALDRLIVPQFRHAVALIRGPKPRQSDIHSP